jgi:protein phosphatase
LWGVVNDQEISRTILEAPTLHRACQNLLEAANLAGGPDNITLILVQLIG